MILADTSAWVEYDRATGSDVHRRIVELLHEPGELAITDPVVMEVVSGAADDFKAAKLRRLLQRHEHLPFVAGVDFHGATRIYRKCRARGVTPRGLVDCMIASVASRHGAAVLAFDRDLARIAEVMGIELDPASLR